MVVKINLSKPLVSHFTLDGRVKKVEYEDLPLICFHCGKYGHTNEFCKETDHARAMNMDIGIERDLEDGNGSLKPRPWMHAPKRGKRRPKKDSANDGRELNGKSGTNLGVYRFEIFADLEN